MMKRSLLNRRDEQGNAADGNRLRASPFLQTHNFFFGQIFNANGINTLNHGGKLLVRHLGPCMDNTPFIIFYPVEKNPGVTVLAVLLFLVR
ncbi:hypothetical protein KN63_00830 [Smithella sp. F21]|nr:hypothetical protein KN63_00830 [Smithella sp. F21]